MMFLREIMIMFMEFPSKNYLKARRRDLSGFFFKLSEFAGFRPEADLPEMPKRPPSQQPLSALQAFVVSNLKAQAKLKAQLAWLGASRAYAGKRRAIQRRHITEIEAKLAALKKAMKIHHEQEKQRC
jgi:hypothetical protein